MDSMWESTATVTKTQKFGAVVVTTPDGDTFFVPTEKIFQMALRGNLRKGDEVLIKYRPNQEPPKGKQPLAEVRRLQKPAHEAKKPSDANQAVMKYGRIKSVNRSRGFGFVAVEGEPNVFFLLTLLPDSVKPNDDPARAAVAIAVEPDNQGRPVATSLNFVDDSMVPVNRRTGTIKFFSFEKGFGFIIPDQGKREVFLSINEVDESDLTAEQLKEGCKVTYEIEMAKKGPAAVNIQAA